MIEDKVFLWCELKYGAVDCQLTPVSPPVATKHMNHFIKQETIPPLLYFADLTDIDNAEKWIKKILKVTALNKDAHFLTYHHFKNSKLFHEYIISKSKEINFITPYNKILVLWQGNAGGMPIIRSIKAGDVEIEEGWTREGHIRRRHINDYWKIN